MSGSEHVIVDVDSACPVVLSQVWMARPGGVSSFPKWGSLLRLLWCENAVAGMLLHKTGVRGSAVSAEVIPWLLLEARSVACFQAMQLVVYSLCLRGCAWFLARLGLMLACFVALWLLPSFGPRVFPALLWSCGFC